jgi:hypothetical protein
MIRGWSNYDFIVFVCAPLSPCHNSNHSRKDPQVRSQTSLSDAAMNVLDCCSDGTEVDGLVPRCVVSEQVFEHEALTVDHLSSTPLFEAIQQSDWGGVRFFLDSGSSSLSPFEVDEDDCKLAVADQVETWVVCENEAGELMWRQLPIHAAICYGAPFNTIKELVKIYPTGLCCGDNDGNLPIHLAVKFNCSEKILRLLLKAFPEGIEAVNGSGKMPLECAEDACDQATRWRYELIQTVVSSSTHLGEKSILQKQTELEAIQQSTKEASENLSKAKRELSHVRTIVGHTIMTSADRGSLYRCAKNPFSSLRSSTKST